MNSHFEKFVLKSCAYAGPSIRPPQPALDKFSCTVPSVCLLGGDPYCNKSRLALCICSKVWVFIPSFCALLDVQGGFRGCELKSLEVEGNLLNKPLAVLLTAFDHCPLSDWLLMTQA